MPQPSSVAAEGDLPASPLAAAERLPELFLNQLVSSELRWRELAVRLTLEAGEEALGDASLPALPPSHITA